MSYKDELSDLDRDGERSLTQQLVDATAAAIERGELGPGEKLPPTRELAKLADINHLTAVRAYRRLRELGLVSAHVGRGTFVREAATAPARAVPDSIAWQRYALPESNLSYGDRVLADMHRHATSEELIPLSVGYPSARLFPVEEISEAVDATLRSEPERALQYSDVQGLPDLAEQVASLSAARGAAEDPMLKAKNVPVILSNILSMPQGEDAFHAANYQAAGLLSKAGVLFAFSSGGYDGARLIPFQAAMSVAWGLNRDEAIKALTINPAKIFGADKALGTLEAGKVANLLVVSGDPLEIRSRIQHVVIGGREIPLESKHTELFKRFMGRQ